MDAYWIGDQVFCGDCVGARCALAGTGTGKCAGCGLQFDSVLGWSDLVHGDLDDPDLGLPTDMAKAVRDALSSYEEAVVQYRFTTALDRDGRHADEVTHYLYFPNAGRGAVCQGGDAEWTDCSSLDDLMTRWAKYDESWTN